MTKPLLEALNGNPQAVPPVWLMRQAGRYLPEYRETRSRAKNFLEFCYTPELAATATLQPIERFGMDGAVIFSDILVVPDALGQPIAFVEGKGPVLEPLQDTGAVARLETNTIRDRLAPVYDVLRMVSEELPEKVALIGFAGAPWTIATYMIEGGSSRDFARAKRWAYEDPDGFARLTGILVDVISEHLSAQVEAGAEVLQVFDSWAGILPEDAFRRWSIAPIAEIVTRVREKHPQVPIIGFPNRAGVMYEAFTCETGVDAVSIDASVPLCWARDVLQPQACVQGNLDPVALLTGGAAMHDAARKIVAALKGGPHVFNLGHGVLPATPPEHVAELVACVRESAERDS